MVWVRLADDFTDHPKVVTAGPLASWLYVCGLTYANRYLTDGFIPAGQVRRMADVEDPQMLAGRLVDAGLWEVVDGGYLIHDYHGYQPSSENVKRERDEAAKRQAESRARRGKNGSHAVTDTVTGDVTHAVTDTVSSPVSSGAPYPDPVPAFNPVPEPGQDPPRPPAALVVDGDGGAGGAAVAAHGADAPPKQKSGGREPKSLAPKRLEPDETDFAAGAELGMTEADVERCAAAMLDHYRAKGELRADWHATLRTWVRNASKFDRPSDGPGQPRTGPPRPPPRRPGPPIPSETSAYLQTRSGTLRPR